MDKYLSAIESTICEFKQLVDKYDQGRFNADRRMEFDSKLNGMSAVACYDNDISLEDLDVLLDKIDEACKTFRAFCKEVEEKYEV